MNLQQGLLSAYLMLPVAALALCAVRFAGPLTARSGEALCVARALLLVALFRFLDGGTIRIAVPLIEVLGVNASFHLTQERALFLFVSELIWLFSHGAGFVRAGHVRGIRALAVALQAVISVLVLSGNMFVVATVMLVAALLLFFLLRFVGEEQKIEEGSALATRAFLTQSYVAAAFFGWVFGQLGFSGAEVVAGVFRPLSTDGNPFVWMCLAILFLWIPVGPWSRWFSRILEVFPEPVSFVTTVLISAGAFRLIEVSAIVYPQPQPEHYKSLYFTGYAAAVMLFSEFFTQKTKRSMLAVMPKILLAMIPMMVGISAGRDLVTPLIISVFAPAFTLVALVASVVVRGTQVSRLFVVFFLYLIYGMPGSPVFLFFGYLGSQSSVTGPPWIVAFGLLWFLYFFANVHLARRMFVDERAADVGGVPFLSGASPAVVLFAIGIGAVSSFAVWVFGVMP